MTVQYLPSATTLSDFTASRLVTTQGTTYAAQVISLTDLTPTCVHAHCAAFEVRVRVPALNATDGGGGVGTLSVDTQGGATFSTLFTYIAAGDPEVSLGNVIGLHDFRRRTELRACLTSISMVITCNKFHRHNP